MKSLFVLIMLISGHAFAQFVEPHTSAIMQAKVEVESNIEKKPFLKAEHDIFKKYFVALDSFIGDIKASQKLTRRYHNHVSSIGIKTFCKDLFLDLPRWNDLVRNCTKNRFFLCAEEVRAFDVYKTGLRDLLTAEQQELFKKEPACEI